MAGVTLSALYNLLLSLRKDVRTVKYALIPEEKVSAKGLSEIKRIRKEMEAGKEKSFEEVFGK